MAEEMTKAVQEHDDKITVKDLDLYYGSFQALKKINLTIKKNEITALIGPSGCGKSTFLKTLNRMNDLEKGVKIEGDVRLDGKDIFKDMDAIELRKRVGMVFSSRILSQNLYMIMWPMGQE